MKKCLNNKGSFWNDKNCFREFKCENCPVKQEQELGNPMFSNIKRVQPLYFKELFFRDNLAILNFAITTLIVIAMLRSAV